MYFIHFLFLRCISFQVEELRQRLEEKNKLIEKKTQQMIQAQQDRNRLNCELNEMKEHMDIKDRKINVLQRKVSYPTDSFMNTVYVLGQNCHSQVIIHCLIDQRMLYKV